MTRTTSKPRNPRLLLCLLLIMAGAIGLVGYYGPWLPHRAAGLVIIGIDLAEYVKFLPQVSAGQIAIRRELFCLPLFAGSVSASLLASRHFFPNWFRWALALSAVPLALAMLPPAWSPGILFQDEFRVQVLAIALCLALIPGIAATRYLPDWLVLAIIAPIALMAAVAPAWAFLQISPAIALAYKHRALLGWGFYLGFIGFLAEAFLAIAEMLRPLWQGRTKQ